MTEKGLPEKNIVTNRKARRDYEILETREAGIALVGTEVKSLRAGRVNLTDSYASVENGEVILYNLHISQYEPSARENHEPTRPRQLLLHKREIRRLFGATAEKGFTLIPLRIYFKGPYVKVELATARGRRKFDKREAIAKKEADRAIERAHRRRLK
ncbi:MAG: SsrA-binding protein SmpB [Candidatus Zixiibacteriota bacterium]|nr:MAG: SsrA-binding protein SmpB [candidate division Zixibacteria bacterium]